MLRSCDMRTSRRCDPRSRRALSPQPVDQPIDRLDLIRAQQQHRQQRPLLRTRERQNVVAVSDLERPRIRNSMSLAGR